MSSVLPKVAKLITGGQEILFFSGVTPGKTKVTFSAPGKCSLHQAIDHPVAAGRLTMLGIICIP